MTKSDDIKGRIKAAGVRRWVDPGISEQETKAEHDGPPPARIPPPPLPLDDRVSGFEDAELPTNVRGPDRRAGAVPASEEALRVFDEMSALRTFPGEHTGAQTLPPRHGDRIAAGRSAGGDAAMEAETGAYGSDVGSGPLRTPAGGALGLNFGAESRLLSEAWLLFAYCPCPLFRLDAGGRILSANAAMLTFVGCDAEELEGRTLANTRLGQNFPGLGTELQRCTINRTPFQRILTFQADTTNTVRFMLWVVPLPDDVPSSASSAGIILPYPGGG